MPRWTGRPLLLAWRTPPAAMRRRSSPSPRLSATERRGASKATIFPGALIPRGRDPGAGTVIEGFTDAATSNYPIATMPATSTLSDTMGDGRGAGAEGRSSTVARGATAQAVKLRLVADRRRCDAARALPIAGGTLDRWLDAALEHMAR